MTLSVFRSVSMIVSRSVYLYVRPSVCLYLCFGVLGVLVVLVCLVWSCNVCVGIVLLYSACLVWCCLVLSCLACMCDRLPVGMYVCCLLISLYVGCVWAFVLLGFGVFDLLCVCVGARCARGCWCCRVCCFFF